MNGEPSHSVKTPPTDIDIYCLECGYNLRGLSGDPRRCPECGHMNPMGTAEIPAKLITEQLRRLETAPATCAGLSVLAIILLLPISATVAHWRLGGPDVAAIACMAIPFLACMIGIPSSVIRFKESCRDHPGWRSALCRYWLAAVGLALLILMPPILGGLGVSMEIIFFRSDVLTAALALVLWILYIAVVFLLASLTHRRLKRILHPLQRDVAVQIARDTLRKRLHQGGRGPFG